MAQTVIDNPVINSPYKEPSRHFRFATDGITNDVVDGRRLSSYFMPVPKPRRAALQLAFDTEWTQERVEENEFINRARERVSLWRQGGYVGTTATTRRLLEHWQDPEREHPLFFCQIEAAETAIYLQEVASRYGDTWIGNSLKEYAAAHNPGLNRIAFKMATGSGKTVVMAMLIAWQSLNKLANLQDSRFSDAFLVVTPGITIRDRLRVLLPSDPHSYYRRLDLVPPELQAELGAAKVAITNFHSFRPREKGDASRLTKRLLAQGNESAWVESPDEVARRVCRDLGTKRGVVVINDEAHHCYRRKPDSEERLRSDERAEAKEREEEARLWVSGLEAVSAKIGVKAVYDLSATPFFLRGSGYPEGTLFPWVVSDFSLIDAIESGIVKVPRVPVSDDSGAGVMPTYRDLLSRIRDDLPKGGKSAPPGPPALPAELEGALHSLYGNYERAYRRWQQQGAGTPPVFIVVCANTRVSKLVYDYVAGWERQFPDGQSVVAPGRLTLFSNEENGRWTSRPNTILVDSRQLESGEGMSADFKRIASREIEEFRAEYHERFPGRDADELTDEDLLREVMNTVGKPGRLGEGVRCVVSVSMLTEGWDANTVTHILGVRAFSTQLLCEQVIGRGLRRVSYVPDENGFFEPEYAEVYGVPFSFIPTSGSSSDPRLGPPPTRVRAIPERLPLEITFPRLTGYRHELGEKRLEADLGPEATLVLSTRDLPTRTVNAPIVGEQSVHDLEDLHGRREAEVAFLLAKLVLEKYFRADGQQRPDRDQTHQFDPGVQASLFPQVLRITKRWLAECVRYGDGTFPQLLLLLEFAHDAADKIYGAIARGRASHGKETIRPLLRPFDAVGSTRDVDFNTTKPVFTTHPERSHLSHVVADSGWEMKLAETLEDMPEVIAYGKNQGLGFTIPYTLNGQSRNYVPDFLVKLRTPDSSPLTLVLEVSGEKLKEKTAKVETARDLWIPAVNAHGGFGKWAFLEVTNPWEAQGQVRSALLTAL